MIKKERPNLVPNMIAKIKTYSRYDIPSFWNKERMPEYMGQIVTIRCTASTTEHRECFHIKEDLGRGRSEGWYWRDIDFIKVNTIDDRP